jgi:K+-sensing histidine kinase KdpD
MTTASNTAAHQQQLLCLSIGPACHELRSPLAVVYGFAKMLDSQDGLTDQQRQFIEHILRGSERLDTLLDLFARMGRIAADRAHPQPEHIPLAPILSEVAESADIESKVIVDDGVSVSVEADPAWLREAFLNIVSALSFEAGIDVRFSWLVESGDVVVSVIPSSSYPVAGIEPDKAALGIALARMQLVAMGGSLDGRSDRVVVTLPRH